MTFRLLLLLGVVAVTTRASSPTLVVQRQPLGSPAAQGAAGIQLAAAGKLVGMVWMPRGSNGSGSVHWSQLDPASLQWSPARVVAQGADFAADSVNAPQIAVSAQGAVAVLWYTTPRASGMPHEATQAWWAFSSDQGRHWSAPIRVTQESGAQEFASLAFLPDGRLLAVWLDGRTRSTVSGGQSLCARILLPKGDHRDSVVDTRVCDCCPTALATFPDGSAQLIYRDRTDDEIRDVSTARLDENGWAAPRPLGREGWKIAGCPVNGPALSSSGAHASAAWFTAASGEPAVFASLSRSGGEPFLLPVRVDDARPLGHVATAMSPEGTAFVSWLEKDRDDQRIHILLRRLDADSRSVPVRVGSVSSVRSGPPRLLCLPQGSDSAETRLLLAHIDEGAGESRVITQCLTVAAPEPVRDPCATCPPSELRGHPVHGNILSIDADTGTVQLKHDRVPGLTAAMTRTFRVTTEELKALSGAREIYGRIELRDDGWWLFSVTARSSVPVRR